MIDLKIDPQLKAAAPALAVGCLTARVRVTVHDEALWEEIVKDEDDHVDWLEEQLDQIGHMGLPIYLSAQTRE